MGLLFPALLLLAVPAALVWWQTRVSSRVTDALRLAVAALVVLALAGPYLKTQATGRDLVVVVDRSRSMPREAQDSALELIRLAEEQRANGDRVAVIAFGADTVIERFASDTERFRGFERPVAPDGSDLGAALETALNLIEDGRRGAILLISDGENNGRDALPAARRAFARGVRIDVRGFPKPNTADLSVERLDLPGEVAVGEPFQFNVWVRSDRRVEADFELSRAGRVLSSGRRVFEEGLNRLVFRDVLERSGVAEYEVKLDGGSEDRVPENNRGLGAVMASGAPALLVLNDDGREDTLVRALRQARIPVAVATPEGARLDPIGLSSFRAVILENVAASRLGRGTESLKRFVLDRGGGLLLTGGQASFGVGGYYLSPLDDLLPVSMELRQEHRKMSIALAITLDRSGSMGAPVAGGLRKMDLANLGTVAAIELLSPMDSVAVIAVDSSAHLIQALTQVTDVDAITSRVRRIESMGGGIFTYTALLAAGKELAKAQQLNKHIILFADAADAEEHEGCADLLQDFRASGVTLSVIALGTDADSDAQFLKEIAAIGGGEAYFTMDPADLPRLFALDTMTAARSAFVDQPASTAMLPDLFGMGAIASDSFPTIDGYNLTYMRPEATAGVVTTDENQAPVFAFMQQGLGRTAAYTGQIGGSFGGSVVAWDGFATFFVTAARWLLGQEEPEEFFTSVRREGKDAVLTVEVDPDAPMPPDTSQLTAVLASSDGRRTEVTLERTGEYLFEARYPLEQEGVLLGTVRLGENRFVSLPPIVLPYSPEFERSPDPERGERLLRRLARESGGEVGVPVNLLFRGEREGRAWRLVSRELVLLALILLLVEIAGRRLSLWSSLRVPPALSTAGAFVASTTRRLIPRLGQTRAARAPTPAPAARPDAPRDGPKRPSAPQPHAAEPAQGSEGLSAALSRARRAAEKKLDR